MSDRCIRRAARTVPCSARYVIDVRTPWHGDRILSVQMVKVLVIDDDEVIGELIGSILTDAGHAPMVVPLLDRSSAEAAPEVVVTDLVTLIEFRPDAAREWVGRIREQFPTSAVLVCTAHQAAGEVPDGLGADAVITKPFELDHFISTVERLAATR